MSTCTSTIRRPGGSTGSTRTRDSSSGQSAPVRSLSVVAMVTVFYGLLVALTLAYEISMAGATP